MIGPHDATIQADFMNHLQYTAKDLKRFAIHCKCLVIEAVSEGNENTERTTLQQEGKIIEISPITEFLLEE